jgi:hypothetical protein
MRSCCPRQTTRMLTNPRMSFRPSEAKSPPPPGRPCPTASFRRVSGRTGERIGGWAGIQDTASFWTPARQTACRASFRGCDKVWSFSASCWSPEKTAEGAGIAPALFLLFLSPPCPPPNCSPRSAREERILFVPFCVYWGQIFPLTAERKGPWILLSKRIFDLSFLTGRGGSRVRWLKVWRPRI